MDQLMMWAWGSAILLIFYVTWRYSGSEEQKAKAAPYTYDQFRKDTLNPSVPVEDVVARCGGKVPEKKTVKAFVGSEKVLESPLVILNDPRPSIFGSSHIDRDWFNKTYTERLAGVWKAQVLPVTDTRTDTECAKVLTSHLTDAMTYGKAATTINWDAKPDAEMAKAIQNLQDKINALGESGLIAKDTPATTKYKVGDLVAWTKQGLYTSSSSPNHRVYKVKEVRGTGVVASDAPCKYYLGFDQLELVEEGQALEWVYRDTGLGKGTFLYYPSAWDPDWFERNQKSGFYLKVVRP